MESDDYLSKRIEQLSEKEKNVVLMNDEMYVTKRAEFSAPKGEIYGLTSTSEIASTVLTFMASLHTFLFLF